MANNFNPQRDNRHPGTRNSDYNRSERSSQPNPTHRTRPSRVSIDRGWENGAPQQHADYKPRQDFRNSSSTQQGRRFDNSGRGQRPERDHSYGYQGNPNQRQDGYRGAQQDQGYSGGYRGPQGYQGRPAGQGQRTNARPYTPGGRPARPYDRDQPNSSYHPQGRRAPQNNGMQSERWTRDPEHSEEAQRAPRPYTNRPDRFQENTEHNRYQDRPNRFQNERGGYQDRPQRFQENRERGGYQDRERENFTRGKRPAGPYARRDNTNPRWQSRPGSQPEYRSYERPAAAPRPYERPNQVDRTEFEGDYEGLTNEELNEQQPFEKRVTRLPDGRVLKGPRPVQRQQAAFWTDVNDEAENLLSEHPVRPVPLAQPVEEVEAEEAPHKQDRPKPAPKAKKPVAQVRTVQTARPAIKGTGTLSKKEKERRRMEQRNKPVTRPSQRGFKWS